MAVQNSVALPMYVTAFDPCKSKPCQNNGVCSRSSQGFVCTCRENFGGTTCQCTYCLIPVYLWTIQFAYIAERSALRLSMKTSYRPKQICHNGRSGVNEPVLLAIIPLNMLLETISTCCRVD